MLNVKSIRPASNVKFWGIGNATNPFNVGAQNKNGVGLWMKSSGNDDNRTIYACLNMAGVGAGEAVRARAVAQNAAAATGGTLNGIHATVALDASAAISGQAFGARITFEAAADTRTLNGNCAPLGLDSYIGANNTVPATMAFIRITDVGSVPIKKLFRLPTVASAGLLAAHTTQTITHSIRCVDDAGTVFYIMCTNDATNRTGGA